MNAMAKIDSKGSSIPPGIQDLFTYAIKAAHQLSKKNDKTAEEEAELKLIRAAADNIIDGLENGLEAVGLLLSIASDTGDIRSSTLNRIGWLISTVMEINQSARCTASYAEPHSSW